MGSGSRYHVSSRLQEYYALLKASRDGAIVRFKGCGRSFWFPLHYTSVGDCSLISQAGTRAMCRAGMYRYQALNRYKATYIFSLRPAGNALEGKKRKEVKS